MPDSSPTPTELLQRAARGDSDAAAEVVPLVYTQLRDRADAYLRREQAGHTLQPTALVHEAYVRLVGQRDVDWQGRTHFLATAAQEMRRILVDHARRRRSQKRGGSWERVTLSDATTPDGDEVELLDLDEALEALEALDVRLVRIVELRFFGGLTVQEIAEQLGLGVSTVEKDWRMAKAWLYRYLGDESKAE